PEAHRDILESWARTLAPTRTPLVLWTDIPRADFRAAAGDPSNPHTQMLQWARRHQITVVGVDEFFPRQAPMQLHAQYQLEMNKLVGEGYGAASDILRLEILHRFGGFYTDVDNEVTNPNGLFEAFEQHGFAVHGESAWLQNSAIMAARQHEFVQTALDTTRDNYALTQREL